MGKQDLLQNKYTIRMYLESKYGRLNMPTDGTNQRQQIDTGSGIVTPGCIKFGVRNYLREKYKDQAPYKIYHHEKTYGPADPHIIADLDAYIKQVKDEYASGRTTSHRQLGEKELTDIAIAKALSATYADIRYFGDVFTPIEPGALDYGQVTGPVSITKGKTVDPISQYRSAITRCAVTTAKDMETKSSDMGSKYIVPYGLYAVDVIVDPNTNNGRKGTGFTEADLDVLIDALNHWGVVNKSSQRPQVDTRKMIIFKHNCPNGNTTDGNLLSLIHVDRKIPDNQPARDISDYNIYVDQERKPKEVELQIID